jgi:hypothetical protein
MERFTNVITAHFADAQREPLRGRVDDETLMKLHEGKLQAFTLRVGQADVIVRFWSLAFVVKEGTRTDAE